jgi:hypothetical protein
MTDKPEDGAPALRTMLLAAKPSDFGLAPTAELPRVWAALMEWHVKNGVVSLVAVAEGSTSLYFSTGGGILGGGEHEAVRAENRKLLAFIEKSLEMFVPVDSPLPVLKDAVTFTVRTYDGIRGARDKEERITQQKSPLWPAFYLGQGVITALRVVTEKPSAGEPRV